jgi:uncharacterized membrane protein
MPYTLHVPSPFLALAATALCAACTAPAFGQNYSFTTLDYPVLFSTYATGINNRGLVVGYVDLPLSDFGFLYDSDTNTFTTISVPDSPRTSLTGINDRGDIVGHSTDPFSGFLYRDGAFTPILHPDVLGINNKGDIIGGFVDIDSFGNASRAHGFIFNGKTYQTIDYPGSTGTRLTGINDHGQVVGQYTVGDSIYSFLWDRGTYIPLAIPGKNGRVTGINNRGEIIGTYDGYCASQDVNGGLSFVYDHGSYTCFVVPDAISTQPGGRFAATFATGINDRGQIVGYWYDRATSAIRSFIATPQSDNNEADQQDR